MKVTRNWDVESHWSPHTVGSPICRSLPVNVIVLASFKSGLYWTNFPGLATTNCFPLGLQERTLQIKGVIIKDTKAQAHQISTLLQYLMEDY